MKNSNLKKWFKHFNCDKGGIHSYDSVYEPHLDQYESQFNLLEVGIFKGASSRAFLSCYENLVYYGLDIFERHSLVFVADLMSNDRFNVLVADSTSNYVQDIIIREWGDVKFDVIIDDGSHFHNDISDTLENLYPFLKGGGTYFIEDFFPLNFEGLTFNNTPTRKKKIFFLDHSDQFNQGSLNRLFDTVDSLNPTNVEHFDLRVQDNTADSYVIKITK